MYAVKESVFKSSTSLVIMPNIVHGVDRYTPSFYSFVPLSLLRLY